MAAQREETSESGFVRAATSAEVQLKGCMAVELQGMVIVLVAHAGRVFALDNRCPHMGFPLERGSVKDGILTCHWHHARFDLAGGGTLDPWADDVRAFPVEVRDGEVWVDLRPRQDAAAYHSRRIREGLERNIPLVLAKGVLNLLQAEPGGAEPFRIGLHFGTLHRQAGWGAGLTTHVCMMNLLPCLGAQDRPRALYRGLSAVAQECQGEPPRFLLRPLPGHPGGDAQLKRWFRQFVEVRDSEGAERCIATALQSGASPPVIADMLFTAATDHRYLSRGHVADFTNKAFEALDVAGWDLAEPVITSLIPAYAQGERMEESNAWRNPDDLIALLEQSFTAIPEALRKGEKERSDHGEPREVRTRLAPLLVDGTPGDALEGLLSELRAGATAEQVAGAVAYAAALRIARFHTSNEFGDWDTALHTFTFANAIHQAMRRAPSAELVRGVFDAAMSIHLDRFLNVPPARLPAPADSNLGPAEVLALFPATFDQQQQVSRAAELVAQYLASGEPAPLLAMLGSLLLREDLAFHTIQVIEASFSQYRALSGIPEGGHVLVAAARYLAAHAPTPRASEQTFTIARRLHRGERLFE